MATTTVTGRGTADVREVDVGIGASRRAIVRIDGSVLAHRPDDDDNNNIDDECDEGVRTGRRGGCDDVNADDAVDATTSMPPRGGCTTSRYAPAAPTPQEPKPRQLF